MPRWASSCWARWRPAPGISKLIQTLKPGEKTRIAGYDVTLVRVDNVQGPNYVAERATLAVTVGGRPFTVLQPERRLFTRAAPPGRRDRHPHQRPARSLRHPGRGRCATPAGSIRLYLNPLAPWIWLGAALCAFGGFVSLSDRRLRIGAPTRRTWPGRVTGAPE